MTNILLVEPEFPIPSKSKNHKDFLPIGLLKIGAMYQDKNENVKLVRGNLDKNEIKKAGDKDWNKPEKILITSLFTYWKPEVEETVEHYNEEYPEAEIIVGGIYASLMPGDCEKISGVDKVYEGVHSEAEKFEPNYDLINHNSEPLDYQIIHTSRGCPRECDFCGVWKIEPKFSCVSSVKDKIFEDKKGVVFYDNNLLKNPNIENILDELIQLKKKGEITWCESQSGFDGRILIEKPHLAEKIYKAGFRYVRIAWDWGYEQKDEIKEQINIFIKGGYRPKELFIFMIYNWEIPFNELEKKRVKCFEWGVQISDCRYRPLDQTFDRYNPHKYKKGQTKDDYYIHDEGGWTDPKIRQFRKNVREHNICIRHNKEFYSPEFERKKLPKEEIIGIYEKISKFDSKDEIKNYLDERGITYFFPDETRPAKNYTKKVEDFQN